MKLALFHEPTVTARTSQGSTRERKAFASSFCSRKICWKAREVNVM
jgi:hypothetical protein